MFGDFSAVVYNTSVQVFVVRRAQHSWVRKANPCARVFFTENIDTTTHSVLALCRWSAPLINRLSDQEAGGGVNVWSQKIYAKINGAALAEVEISDQHD